MLLPSIFLTGFQSPGGMLIQGGIFADFHHRVALAGWHAYGVGRGAAWFAVFVVGSAIFGYWTAAERTKPWLVRKATLS